MLSTVLASECEKCTEYDNLQFSIFLSLSNHVFLLLQMARSVIPQYGWYSDFFYPVSHSFLPKTLRDDDSHSPLVMLNNCVRNGKAMFLVVCFVSCSAKQENNHVLRHTNFCYSGKEKIALACIPFILQKPSILHFYVSKLFFPIEEVIK